MSGDPREVDARCTESLQGPDLLRRYRYGCVFREGHLGLHKGRAYTETGLDAFGPALHWGSPQQLNEELAMNAAAVGGF